MFALLEYRLEEAQLTPPDYLLRRNLVAASKSGTRRRNVIRENAEMRSPLRWGHVGRDRSLRNCPPLLNVISLTFALRRPQTDSNPSSSWQRCKRSGNDDCGDFADFFENPESAALLLADNWGGSPNRSRRFREKKPPHSTQDLRLGLRKLRYTKDFRLQCFQVSQNNWMPKCNKNKPGFAVWSRCYCWDAYCGGQLVFAHWSSRRQERHI